MRISGCMTHYVYQIQGALENAQGRFCGFRVLVCDPNNFDSVDVPREVIGNEVAQYLQYRLKLADNIEIQKLPTKVQVIIRTTLGKWLDRWVLENFYGNTSNTKSPDAGLLEDGK